MKSPDSSDKDQQITQLTQEKSQLETQIAEKDKTISELQTQKPTEEIKSKVIESSKQLGLFSSEFQHKLDKVNSYQELVKLQEAEFSYCLNREISDKKSAGYLNIGLGVIAVGSLVILG
jgi:predicted  nucleic acid-binding Zn-ribbon protein